ncbi:MULTISPECIES: Crp/Fnr family transcriptional regulator [Chryseobacterium]|jgi:CRP-like cAMP-binding protein|uniref:Cyclic nucleotide-binding protein n=1 Tax=Chryseobacterium lathyri TaxID=395933 RepID=A0A511YAS6_9FLAO|nr:Crp/Fnr family transcriptional regulator [Chryseobacterium lathyri]GEN72296.1 cyclic nucleotide-binding protein [Chryseobacterium lathyri]
MNSPRFTQTIESIIKPEQSVMEALTSNLEAKTYRKGDFLLKGDETCRYFYFLEKGLVKLFFDNGDKDFIMTFFAENSFFTELNGFLTGSASKYMIVALEPCEVLRIHKNVIEELCKKYHTAETLFSKLYSKAPINMMGRISEMLEDDGKKRYNNFLKQRPDLIQRISLGDMADYIGITQVSLSRIRAQK